MEQSKEVIVKGIQCPICLNVNPGYKEQQPLVVLTSCNHAFCDGCLSNYINSDKFSNQQTRIPCPTCKQSFDSTVKYKIRIFANIEDVNEDNQLKQDNNEDDWYKTESLVNLSKSIRSSTNKIVYFLNNDTDLTLEKYKFNIDVLGDVMVSLWDGYNWYNSDNTTNKWNELIECTTSNSSLYNDCNLIYSDSILINGCKILQEVMYDYIILRQDCKIFLFLEALINWITKAKFSNERKMDLLKIDIFDRIIKFYFRMLRDKRIELNIKYSLLHPPPFDYEWMNLWNNIYNNRNGIYCIDSFTSKNCYQPIHYFKDIIYNCFKLNSNYLLDEKYLFTILYPIKLYINISHNNDITLDNRFTIFFSQLILICESVLCTVNKNKINHLRINILKILIEIGKCDKNIFITTINMFKITFIKLIECLLSIEELILIINRFSNEMYISLLNILLLFDEKTDQSLYIRNKCQSYVVNFITNMTTEDTYKQLITKIDKDDKIDKVNNFKKLNDMLFPILSQLAEIYGRKDLIKKRNRDEEEIVAPVRKKINNNQSFSSNTLQSVCIIQ